MQIEVCHFRLSKPLFGDPGAEFEELRIVDLLVVGPLIRILLRDDRRFAQCISVLNFLLGDVQVHPVSDQRDAVVECDRISCVVLAMRGVHLRYLREDLLELLLVDRVNHIDFAVEQLFLSEGVPIQALIKEELGQLFVDKHGEGLVQRHREVLVPRFVLGLHERAVDMVGQANQDLYEGCTAVNAAARHALDLLAAEVRLGENRAIARFIEGIICQVHLLNEMLPYRVVVQEWITVRLSLEMDKDLFDERDVAADDEQGFADLIFARLQTVKLDQCLVVLNELVILFSLILVDRTVEHILALILFSFNYSYVSRVRIYCLKLAKTKLVRIWNTYRRVCSLIGTLSTFDGH